MNVTAIRNHSRRAMSALVPLAALLFVPAPAQAAPKATAKAAAAPKGDAVHGQQLYAQCKICHSVDTDKNLIGPSLKGVVGRKSGEAVGFNYSANMKKAGLTWTPQTLSEFLTAPMKKVPGTRMAYGGMAKPEDRDDLIAYLAKNK
jgi:cytochrome c2